MKKADRYLRIVEWSEEDQGSTEQSRFELLDNRRGKTTELGPDQVSGAHSWLRTMPRYFIWSVITISQRHTVHLRIAEYGNDFARDSIKVSDVLFIKQVLAPYGDFQSIVRTVPG